MFAFCAAAPVTAVILLSVSAGYFRTHRASVLRFAFSLALAVGGAVCAAISAVLFYRSGGAQLEWAENAFSMFTRFALWVTAAAAVLLTGSVFAGKKTRHRIVRYAVGILFCIGMILMTALFSYLSEDADTFVHGYVRAFGVGCSVIPFLFVSAEEARFILRSRRDKNASLEQNK